MAKTVAQLNEQIQRIQKQIEAVEAKEARGVVTRIREAIEHYGLTPEDLFGDRLPAKRGGVAIGGSVKKAKAPRNVVPETPSAKRSGPKKGGKLPPKFSDGAGNTWSGRGSTSLWLKDAIAAGKAKEDFAIKAE